MKKIVRNMSSDDTRAFWSSVEDSAREVAGWPAWRRAGINVAQTLAQDRRGSEAPSVTSESKTLLVK